MCALREQWQPIGDVEYVASLRRANQIGDERETENQYSSSVSLHIQMREEEGDSSWPLSGFEAFLLARVVLCLLRCKLHACIRANDFINCVRFSSSSSHELIQNLIFIFSR